MTHLPLEAVFIRPIAQSSNRYCARFADALAQAGLEPIEFGYGLSDVPSGQVPTVYHWPDEFFQFRGWRHYAESVIKLMKLRKAGQPLVWVAHNLEPHRRDRRSSPLLREAFFRLLDGVIFLSDVSRRDVLARYPSLRGKPTIVIAHGVYDDVSPRPACLPVLGDRPLRAALIGRITPYKQPIALAERIAARAAGDIDLTIAGTCDDKLLTAKLRRLEQGTERVRLDLRYLEDADLAALVDASDVIIMPYASILNSGSALFALSRWRPVVAPRLGSLPELQAQVGSDWLHLFEGDFSDARLQEAIAWVNQNRSVPPDLSAHEWKAIGTATVEFLRELCNAPTNASVSIG
jgi:hypothetical protein